MKKKSTTKRLTLSKETLLSLEKDAQLIEAAGGGRTFTCTTACSLCTP